MTAWKPFKEKYYEGLNYMIKRRSGELTSLKTKWERFNYAGLDGIEIQSTVIIAGRPGSFKTALKDEIIRSIFECNPTLKMRVLDFQFEMIGRVTALREFASILGKSYKYLCSAERNDLLSKQDYELCLKYTELRQDYDRYPVDLVEENCTVQRFGEIIDEYMELHSFEEITSKGVVKKYVPTLIPIDHSILFDKANDEGTLNDTLAALGKTLTKKKRQYPIIFILLSQLNREIEKAGRNEERKYGNYISTSDIYGSDILLMHADMVVAIDRPATRNIRYYGPLGYIIEDDTTLVLRWLKARNGENQLSFFNVNPKAMIFEEREAPANVRDIGKK